VLQKMVAKEKFEQTMEEEDELDNFIDVLDD